ncbi:MAG: GNAT family N-acetyltransferase [Ruminococcaceae bacterium]|nr:GNAT family N-acetyltransferase [Oscillospiraceae bacterium]
MEYYKTVKLKDERECILRNGVYSDGEIVLELFKKTHSQTDFLLSYPDEVKFTVEEESDYLQKKTESEGEIEILAELDGVITGSAGIERVGIHEKLAHRCDFGVSVDKEYWGFGIGKALLEACIECAKKAGYAQMELEVVADNERAVQMYKKAGFVEYGRNPRDFKSRLTGYQEVIYMRLELD